MEPQTDATPPAPTAGNWYDRLPPTARALIVTVATVALNAALAWMYTHLSPGTTVPQLPVPQVQSAAPPVIVLNVGQPAAPAAPVQVAGK